MSSTVRSNANLPALAALLHRPMSFNMLKLAGGRLTTWLTSCHHKHDRLSSAWLYFHSAVHVLFVILQTSWTNTRPFSCGVSPRMCPLLHACMPTMLWACRALGLQHTNDLRDDSLATRAAVRSIAADSAHGEDVSLEKIFSY